MRTEVKRVACVGVGLIGQSWAALFASKGYQVVMQDVNKNTLSRGLKGFNSILSILEENEIIRSQMAAHARKQVHATTSLSEAVENADYIQESVFENCELKRIVFKEMDRVAPEHAILASSSSSILMSKIQTHVKKRQRCLIVHPFNPVHLVPLVELVPGRWTSPETIAFTYDLMRAVGKVPIKVKSELPGFVANRLTAAVWREAIDLLIRGAASAEDIDRACRFGPAIRWAVQGPFLTYHMGGGAGGIEYFLDHLTPSFESRWKSMATWKTLPSGARRRIIRSVEQMTSVRKASFQKLGRRRDGQLIRLLEVQEASQQRRR
jgi:3-hydroxypropionate dehydrogenase (NADP+)